MSGRERTAAPPVDREPTWVGLAWISPWLAGFLLFMALPIGLSFVYSLSDFPLLEPPIFVGLENYRQLLRDPVFGQVLLNTLIYAGVAVPVGTALAVLVAVALNRRLPGVTVYRAAVFVPSLVPVAAAAMIFLWVFNGDLGLINRALDPVLGLVGGRGPDWLGDRVWAMAAIILVSFWTIGPAVVICQAALQDVPAELQEAAALDGLGAAGRFRHVTLPLISPVVLFLAIVSLINAWQIFALPFIMTGGGPERATYFYSMYIYDAAFAYGRMGYACALAWIQLLIVLAVTAVMLRIGQRMVFYRAG